MELPNADCCGVLLLELAFRSGMQAGNVNRCDKLSNILVPVQAVEVLTASLAESMNMLNFCLNIVCMVNECVCWRKMSVRTVGRVHD